ncbi:hypothetical protein ABZ208_37025 [Streptomyces sp. NPDC006208]|uniref:hypothetical protein n=1 Tax=Streptomyces sp. NPDC006208 TaxID=3156734 RepID=UPI0033B2A121
MTWNRHTPAYAVARLARHPGAEVRALVAARPDVGPDLVAELREDPDEDVRMCAPPPIPPHLGRVLGDPPGHRARP